jgi:two-component system sensor histidine kinase EvgS
MAVGSPILQRKYCLAVAEGNSALLAELNEGLSILKETGKYDEIYNKWFGVYAGQPPTLVKAFKNLIWIFLPLLALTIAGFLWSWTLKKQVNRRIIELRGELRERRRVEEALRTTNDLLSLFIKHSPIYAFIKEVSPTESRTLHASDNYRDMVGISGSAMAGKTMQEIFPAEFAAKLTADDWLVASGGEILRLDEDFNGRNYTTIKFPIVLGEKTLLAGYTIDITERKRTEDKLLQAQKMESIGRLAGGVAHDFNNMLGVILGYAEMTLDQVEAGTSIHSALQEIQQAARRSANLTRQLLAFARKQTVTPRILDLNTTVANMLNMLQRLIGEDIDLSWLPGENLGAVRIDPSQIDQILANLCVNARDALGYPGRITIETANVVADETYRAAHGYFVPGEYVRLAVSDNGCGMDRDTVSHLFEPFFTTKKIGDGTGLGLATTYGIVKQNNGFINVYSEPGLGTTFKIYLPCYPVKERQPSETVEAEAAVSGRETILLVEDEPMILQLSATMLNRLGYEVIAAGSPGEAIRLAEEHGGEIHLLMTDVVMPEMNGRDLARNLLSLYPDLKRLFMSGYTADIIAHHGVLDEGVNFIQKPFTFKDLSVKVREALDQA